MSEKIGISGRKQLLYKFRSGVKRMLYFLVFYSGLLHILIVLFENVKKSHPAVILFYHRFCQKGRKDNILPHLDIGEFEKQIRHLKKLYSIISMEEIAEGIRSKKSFKRPSVAVTIDDGYLDSYTLAYPILRRYRVPVTIYLTAGLIGTRLGLWVDDLEYALINTRARTFCFEELFGDKVISLSTFQEKEKALDGLFFAMVRKSNPQRQVLICRLFSILKVDSSAIDNRVRLMLNWDEINEMLRSGVSFGAHTISHPFLPAMELETAKNEISQSKEIVERQLKNEVRHFAIPNGKREDFTSELQNFCKEVGFDTVVTTESGVVNSSPSRLSLRRVLPSPPLYYFACEVARYFFFPRPDDNFEISFGDNPMGERG